MTDVDLVCERKLSVRYRLGSKAHVKLWERTKGQPDDADFWVATKRKEHAGAGFNELDRVFQDSGTRGIGERLLKRQTARDKRVSEKDHMRAKTRTHPKLVHETQSRTLSLPSSLHSAW